MDASSQRPIVEPWAATTTTDPRTITSWSWRAESARTISGKYRPRSRPRSETTCARSGPDQNVGAQPVPVGLERQSRPSGRWSRASPASGTSGSETRSRATSTTVPLLAPHATTFASPTPARHREDGRDRLSRWSGRAVREPGSPNEGPAGDVPFLVCQPEGAANSSQIGSVSASFSARPHTSVTFPSATWKTFT